MRRLFGNVFCISFIWSPGGGTVELLGALVQAHTIMSGALMEDQAERMEEAVRVALPREAGRVRLLVLLAAGREAEAKVQLAVLEVAVLPGEEAKPMSERLAQAYVGLAGQFVNRAEQADLALRWARRAAELGPQVAEAQLIQVGLVLQAGDDTAALAAAKRFVELMGERGEAAYQTLLPLEVRWRGSGIWAELRGMYADYPEALRATTRPAGAVSAEDDGGLEPENVESTNDVGVETSGG